MKNIPDKYITCLVNGQPFVSHESAVQMALDMGGRIRFSWVGVKTISSKAAELLDFDDKLILVVFEGSIGYCPFAFKVFVDGHQVEIRLEFARKQEPWACSFSGKILFPDQEQIGDSLREFIRKFLEKRIFGRTPSVRELGLETALNLLSGKKIRQKQIDCCICR